MDSDVEKLKNEIHRKVGRNTLLFQRLEMLLKHLVVKGNFSVRFNSLNLDELSAQQQIEQKENSVVKKPMGCVKEQFKKTVLTEPKMFPEEIGVGSGDCVISSNISYGTSHSQKDLSEKLNLIVADRNKLIHEFYTSFDTSTREGCIESELYLDQQYKTVLPVFEELKNLAIKYIEISKKGLERLHDLTRSNEWLNFPCVTELVVNFYLFAIAMKKADIFGWASLADAKKFLCQQFPMALKECQEKFGLLSIKKILLKIGYFDLLYLPTGKERYVVLYRFKPQYSIESDNGELYFCELIQDSEGESICKVSLSMSVKHVPDSLMSPN